MAAKEALAVVQKKCIAKAAAALITAEDFVFLDAGSTTLALVRELSGPALDARYVTNGVAHFTKAFLGANGVALDAGFTTPDPEEAAVKATVVRRAREAWFLVDDSKFARIYPAVIAELSGGAILTNHCPNPKYRQFTLVKEAGCRNTALGFVAGETGAWLERGLAAQGITTDFIHLEQGMTRINVKIKAGQETELNGAGPDIPESAMEQLEAQLDQLAEGDILILAGSIPSSLPQTTYERLLARLEGHGVHTVVDATRDLLVNVLQYHPFLIKPNDHELGEIVGRTLTTDADITAAARTLQEKGARNVLVSMAGDGALLLDEKGEVHRIGTPKGKVVNSVGAGDSMVAGFVAGYLRSGSYLEALRLGTACGSATAFSLGLAKKEKIDELLNQI